jgi:antitoxin ParD1/3/4
MQITLNSEAEKLLQEQINSGKYTNPNDAIVAALKLLAEKQPPSQPKETVTISAKEATQKLLEEKLLMMREINKVITLEPEQKLNSEKLKDLFERTQSLPEIQDITEEDIAAEIAAYRRGE